MSETPPLNSSICDTADFKENLRGYIGIVSDTIDALIFLTALTSSQSETPLIF
jgi:hypothetical protein